MKIIRLEKTTSYWLSVFITYIFGFVIGAIALTLVRMVFNLNYMDQKAGILLGIFHLIVWFAWLNDIRRRLNRYAWHMMRYTVVMVEFTILLSLTNAGPTNAFLFTFHVLGLPYVAMLSLLIWRNYRTWAWYGIDAEITHFRYFILPNLKR